DLEVLANSVEDSLPAPGSDGPGRKRFQWTVMPKREGRIDIPYPAFAWFDPNAGGYRSSSGGLVKLDVDPAISTAGSNPDAAFPRALSDRPAHPGSRAPVPWGFALAGLALGGTVRLWRRRPRTSASAPEARAWSSRLRAIVGADFWKAAEDAAQ